MSRIRTIKPDFWRDQDLSEISAEAALLAIGLLNHADDEGYFNANPKLIRADVFPLRDLSMSVHGMLEELSKIGYINLFSGSDGRQYGVITNFCKHQIINRPTPSKIKLLTCLHEDSLIDHGGLSAGMEGNGMEGEEEGKGIHPPPLDGGCDVVSLPESTYPPEFEAMWKTYPPRLGGNSKVSAFKAWTARIKSGKGTPETMAAGVLRYRAHVESTGKIGTEYVKTAEAFFGPGLHFNEAWPVKQKPEAEKIVRRARGYV